MTFTVPAVVPHELAVMPIWLVWRSTPKLGAKPGDKPDKVPHYATTGARRTKHGTPEDRKNLITFDQACAAAARGDFTGVGMVFLAEFGLVGLDFDHCVKNGVVDPAVLKVCEGSYTELSPSGTGVHAIFRGALANHSSPGFEVSHSKGYFTYTGQVLPGWPQAVTPLNGAVTQLYDAKFNQGGGSRKPGGLWDGDSSSPGADWGFGDLLVPAQPLGKTLEEAAALLKQPEFSPENYDFWLKTGMSLHHEFRASDGALKLWCDWSRGIKEGVYPGDKELADKWGSFNWEKPGGITFTWLLAQAKAAKADAHYAALDSWKARIAAADERELREVICKEIKADQLDDMDRETLAGDLRARFETLNVKLKLSTISKTITPHSTTSAASQTGMLDEFWLADRMIDQYGENLMYVDETKRWYRWNGVYWEKLSSTRIEQFAMRTIRDLPKEASRHSNTAEFLKFCASSRRIAMVRNVIASAEADSRVIISAEDLDEHPGLLCVQNGIVNLRTGELRAPDRSLRITSCCACKYRPGADAPLWRQTLLDAFSDHVDEVDFFQRLIGYAIMGMPSKHVMVIPYGDGANGKSTILGAVEYVLDTYARSAEVSTFVNDHRSGASSGGARADLLHLKGSRFVCVAEPDQESELREGLVKCLTGSDRISVRPMYTQEYIQFKASWVMFMATNHRPVIKSTDEGIWRRMLLIPFTRNFAKDPFIALDSDREENLKAEAEGILAWCITGTRQFLTRGLVPPATIIKAAEDYRSDQDVLKEWIADECLIGSNDLEDTPDNLWNSWSWWAKPRGLLLKASNTVWLGRKLEKLYPAFRDNKGKRKRKGIQVRDPGKAQRATIDAFDAPDATGATNVHDDKKGKP